MDLSRIDQTALARATWGLALQTALMLRRKAVLSDVEFAVVMAEAAAMFKATSSSTDGEAWAFLKDQAKECER